MTVSTFTHRRRISAIGAAAAVTTALITGCAAGDTEQAQASAPEDLCELGSCETATVDRVVDGDTVDIITDTGSTQRVRVLGVDTPETKKPDTPVQCMGPEASQATTDIAAEGSEVTLVTDQDADSTDKFDRRLAHVVAGDTNLGEELLTRGLATTTSFPHGLTETYDAAEDTARDSDAGLWGACQE